MVARSRRASWRPNVNLRCGIWSRGILRWLFLGGPAWLIIEITADSYWWDHDCLANSRSSRGSFIFTITVSNGTLPAQQTFDLMVS
jgi:hypothetical protein